MAGDHSGHPAFDTVAAHRLTLVTLVVETAAGKNEVLVVQKGARTIQFIYVSLCKCTVLKIF